MNRFFFVSSTAALFSKNSSHFIQRASFFTYSPTPHTQSSITLLWKRRVCLNFTLTSRFRVQCLSTTSAPPARRRRSSKKKLDNSPEVVSPMEEEKDAFYVVRKGDIVGVYKTLNDCQAQVSSSVCDPSVSVYKGYSLPKEAEEYLTSRGLKNASYVINAADAKDDIFGALVSCPFQQPNSGNVNISSKPSLPKRSQEVFESANNSEAFGWTTSADTLKKQSKHMKLDNSVKPQARKCVSCSIEFDGASKGNPGLSGAGAVIRADDGSLVCRVREGVGIATNNVAEYRAIILGLRHALKKGFTQIRVQGDSKLVCMQVQGLWKTKNDNMALLCKQVKELVDKFVSFKISHVLRDFNSEADAQANLALTLKDGEVAESCEEK